MVNMIVNHQNKLENYWSCLRAAIIIAFTVLFLTGCNMNIGGASYTLKKFDEKNFRPLMQTIAAVGWLLGLFLIISGFFKLKTYGQMRTMMSSQSSIVPSLMYLFVGTALLYLPFTAENSLYSIWGSSSVVTYEGSGASSAWTTYFTPIVHLMALVGYVSFIRGWVILSKIGKEGAHHQGASKGFMHILGGLLAINFLGTVEIIKNSFT